jgi:hypothetical protein
MYPHLIFMEQPILYIKHARSPETGLQTSTTTSGVFPQCVSAVQVGRVQVGPVQVVALSGSKVCRDPEDIWRRDDLRDLLHRQARSILGGLHTYPQGALITELVLLPAPVILDSRQQQFKVCYCTRMLVRKWSITNEGDSQVQWNSRRKQGKRSHSLKNKEGDSSRAASGMNGLCTVTLFCSEWHVDV